MASKQTARWNHPPAFGPCVCSQLRRTARKVSAFYDHALSPAGLTITQHALLVNVARAGEIGRGPLALQLGMDRTTLTRNLKPLEAAKLLLPAASTDRRQRLLCLSAEGRQKLRHSYALWEKAQRQFTSDLGPTAISQLRTALKTAESALTKD